MGKILVLFVLSTSLQAQVVFDSAVHYSTVSGGATPSEGVNMSSYKIVLDSVRSDTGFYSVLNLDGTSRSEWVITHGDKVFYNGNWTKNSAMGPVLIYDFSLQAGDTLVISDLKFYLSMDDTFFFIVDSIGEVNLRGHKYPAQFIRQPGMGSGSRSFTFVKDIGSLENGIFHFMCCGFEHWSHLTHLCRNDSLLYWSYDVHVWPNGDSCHPYFNDIEELSRRGLLLYPNPASGCVYLNESIPDMAESLRLYTADGREVPVVFSGDHLDVGHLERGLYVAVLRFGKRDYRQLLDVR